MSRLTDAGRLPPRLIELGADGTAVVYYGEQPLAMYRTLDALLRFHQLTMEDLELVGG